MRRHAAAALGTLLLAALTGCADDGASSPHPRTGTTTMPATTAHYAPDVLLSVSSTGGEGSRGRGVPDVEVRADGTVFLGVDDGLGVATSTLTAEGLDRVRDAFAPVSLRQEDYAESEWTDMPSTSVYSTLGEHPGSIRVYGFGHDDEIDDPDWERLASALASLDELATDAGPMPYRPQTMVVILSPVSDPVSDPGAPWPLTPLPEIAQGWTAAGEACVRARGRDIVTIEEIIETHGRSGLRWSGMDAQVRPVLRDAPAGCTPEPPDRLGIGWFHRSRLAPEPSRPAPVEAWRAADAIEATASAATGEEPPTGALSSYDTVWSAGGTGAQLWVEARATYPVEFRDDRPDVPTTWRVRVDAATGGVLALEVEGEDVRTASRG